MLCKFKSSIDSLDLVQLSTLNYSLLSGYWSHSLRSLLLYFIQCYVLNFLRVFCVGFSFSGFVMVDELCALAHVYICWVYLGFRSIQDSVWSRISFDPVQNISSRSQEVQNMFNSKTFLALKIKAKCSVFKGMVRDRWSFVF